MSEEHNDTAEVIKALRQIAAEMDAKPNMTRKTGMDGITKLDIPLPRERAAVLVKQEKDNGKENANC